MLLACTKDNSENEARVIVRGIAKPVAVSSLKACASMFYSNPGFPICLGPEGPWSAC